MRMRDEDEGGGYEKRVITITLFSKSTWDFETLTDIAFALENKIDTGVVGDWEETSYLPLSQEEFQQAIQQYGYSPEDFFDDEEKEKKGEPS